LSLLKSIPRSTTILPFIFSSFLVIAAVRVYVPIYAKDVAGASAAEAGLVATAYGAVAGLLALPLGFASDRYGRLWFISGGLALITLAVLVMPYNKFLLPVILLHVLAASGSAMLDPSIDAAIGDISSKESYGAAYSLYTISITAGIAAGPPLMGLSVTSFGYAVSFEVMALLASLSTVVSLIIFHRLRHGGRVRYTGLVNLVSQRNVRLGWLIIFLSAGVAFGLQTYVPIYGRFLGFDNFTVGFMVSAILLSTAASRLWAGPIIDRTADLSRLVLFGLMVMAIPPFVVTLVSDVWSILLLMVVEGVGFGLVGILGLVMVAQATTTSDRGSAMGALGVCRYGGFTMGPLIISLPLALLGEFTSSYSLGFAALGVVAILSGLSLYSLLRPKAGK